MFSNNSNNKLNIDLSYISNNKKVKVKVKKDIKKKVETKKNKKIVVKVIKKKS